MLTPAQFPPRVLPCKLTMAGIQLDTWYLSMPPVTRAFMTACVCTTLFVYLGIISILHLYLNFSLITERFEVRFRLNCTDFPFSRAKSSLQGNTG